ncbi:MAG: hypothetical protein HYZ56_01735 [Nitrosopumilales archaeon]|nr:hypothetical protein [Nitrosopumilales archaeon]
MALLLFGSVFSVAFGHKTVNVEQYEIEVGWQIEPPIVGFRNAITFEISEVESENVKAGVTNAFKNLEATAKFGGITKTLDINSDPRPGHYFSHIIPTRTGTIGIDLKGEITGIPIDISVEIEDVENTAVLDFPPSTSSSSQDVSALKNAMSSLQQDVSDIKSKIGDIDTGSANFNAESAYNFGIFGLALGAAGVILAIVAMIKRK